MNCNYKVNIKDIQNKYKFNIFAMGGYNDSDLRKMIESVYYALPRTTVEGTSVTLTDTAFSYMKNKLYATDTSQHSTTGKNLMPNNATTQTIRGIKFTINEDKSITLNGTNDNTGASTLFLITEADNFSLNAGTYNSIATGVAGVNIGAYDGTNYYTFAGATGNSITLANNITFASIYLQVSKGNSTTFNNKKIYPILSLTSVSESTYEPYTNGASPNPDYPQVIHTITGDNEVVVCGKNLFDNNFNNLAFWNTTIGNTTAFAEGNQYLGAYCKVEEGKTYSISRTKLTSRFVIAVGNEVPTTSSTGLVVASDNSAYKIENITIPSGYSYLYLYLSNSSETSTGLGIMINEGSTELPYQPYQSNSVLLTLGDKEICKIGNYEDKIFKAIKGNEIYDSLASEEKATLDYGKWYLRKAIGKIVLDGSETWYKGNDNRYYLQNYRNYFYADGSTNNKNMMSDIANKIDTDALINNPTSEYILWVNWNGNVFFSCLGLSTIYTLEQWTSLMAGHYIYGRLMTPVNELFNDTIQDQLEDIYNNMLSYEGQTNVSQENDDLPFDINSTAIKDLNDL